MNLLISAVTWDKALRAGMSQAELAGLAAELGCQGVEFRQYWQDTTAELLAAVRALARQGLICTYACNEGLLADTREATMTMLAAAGQDLATAAALGAKILRLNLAAGAFDPAFIDAAWWRQAVAGLLREAAAVNIPLAIENGPDPLKSDIKLMAKLLGLFEAPWLRLTFDTGNWLYAGAVPQDALRELSRYVAYVHLKDIVAGPDGLQHSYLGTGLVDVRGVADTLAAAGFDGYMALEFPGGDDPRGRILASKAYLMG